jgi:hypothetical protein
MTPQDRKIGPNKLAGDARGNLAKGILTHVLRGVELLSSAQNVGV